MREEAGSIGKDERKDIKRKRRIADAINLCQRQKGLGDEGKKRGIDGEIRDLKSEREGRRERDREREWGRGRMRERGRWVEKRSRERERGRWVEKRN